MTSCLVAFAAGVVETGFVPLLEREAQLASLGDYAGEARRRDGRLVLIAGEAGAGKSALVEQLQQDLPDARWYWGACAKTADHHVPAELDEPSRSAAAPKAAWPGLATAAD
jgi:hypothetical protein